MQIKIVVIDFALSRSMKRTAARVLPAAFVLVGFGGAVDAAPPTFTAGEPLSAAKLNSTFAELDGRVAKTEARLSGAGKYALGGLYCNSTIATTGDLSALGVAKGWAGARSACQAKCGSSPTAHLCSADEVVRSASAGLPMTSGWFASASLAYPPGYTDCQGFTATGTTTSGVSWFAGGAFSSATYTPCATPLPLLCCDAP